MTIYEIFKMELSSWRKPSRVLLLCSISFLNYGSFIGCIYFNFYLLLLLSTIKKKEPIALIIVLLVCQVLFFVEPKRFVWLKCEIKIGLERKRRKGETKSKTTKILINVVWEWVGSKDG